MKHSRRTIINALAAMVASAAGVVFGRSNAKPSNVEHELYCCHMDCGPGHPAEFELHNSPFNPYDDWTHSCAKHLGDMISDAFEHHVYHINPSREAIESENQRRSKGL